jgi:hypothetical protein
MTELGTEFSPRDATERLLCWVRPSQFEQVTWKTKRQGLASGGYCTVWVQAWEQELRGHDKPFLGPR